MGWHRTTGTTARKAWGVGHAIPSSSINRATEPASKRCPEYPVTPIRPAPWRRFLSRTAIDSVCPLPRCPSPLRKPKNKVAAQMATILRLGIVAWPPIADRSAKAQEISRNNEPFPLFGDRKESLIEKSCREARIFVFTLEESPQRGGSCGKHVKSQRRKRLAKNARDPAPTMGLGPEKERYKQGYLFTYSRM